MSGTYRVRYVDSWDASMCSVRGCVDTEPSCLQVRQWLALDDLDLTMADEAAIRSLGQHETYDLIA